MKRCPPDAVTSCACTVFPASYLLRPVTSYHDIVRDNRLLNGTAVRDRILAEVAERTAEASKKHRLGRLVSISIGDQPEVAIYIRNQARGAAKAGIPFDQQFWPSDLSQEECKARLVAMNDDPNVLGVILQRPVPAHIHGRSLASETLRRSGQHTRSRSTAPGAVQ